MKQILDKAILLLGATVFIFWTAYDMVSLVGFFLCVGLLCSYEYSKEKWIMRVTYTIYMAASFWFPLLGVFIPIFCYDFIYDNEWVMLGMGVICGFQGFLTYGAGLGIVFLLLLSVGAILALSTKRYQILDQEHKRQRDESRELELILKNKNRDLMEKQDYEIHVATLQERNRIAREIHDNVGHMLSRSILQAGALKAINQQKELSEPIELLSDTLNQAMDSIRSSVHNLHDESLELKTAIQNILKDYKMYHINFVYDLSAGLSKELKYCLLMVVKESLSNVVKHSNADEIKISMKEFTEIYQLLIRDNGTFFEEKQQNGIGLVNMKERVQTFGGTIYIQHEKGFQIFISIPKHRSKKK